MSKDYKGWCEIMSKINNLDSSKIFFNEKEIWWCYLGANVGIEQDGKGDNYMRPVLIFKKFNRRICWVIPLSTRVATGTFFFPLLSESNIVRTAILPQMKMIDVKRLIGKIDNISEIEYEHIKKELTAFMR